MTVDQDAFRRTYRDVNERSCAFEKSVLTNQCGCSQAARFCIAEREGVRCGSAEGHRQCLEVLALLRDAARFALRSNPTEGTLAHGKAMKIQVGGLRGIRAAIDAKVPPVSPITDVDSLLNTARERFGALDRLPFSEIMQHVAAYRGKTRAKRRQ
ncbi:MAG: hypothetical protein MUF57_07090 [Gammaproteobacteria bacterium]|nr:hypothetical protein [Gammaproteobacteria bacterium]